MIQLSLFIPPSAPIPAMPPHNGTESSRAGARAARASSAREEQQVLACIASMGTATNQEIAERTGIKESAVCGRTNRLRDLLHIELVAARRKSRFIDGRESQVSHQQWRVKGVSR